MKRLVYILLFILPAIFLFSSCKKNEAALATTDISEKYPMTPGTNAADLFRYNFFTRYQTKILFDFDKKDYWYSMSTVSTATDSIDVFRYVTDTAKQRRAVEFLNAQWLLFYPQSLKQTYLPQYIFVVDRLLDYNSSGTTVDSVKYFKTNGFNNILVTGFGNRMDTMSAATKARLRNELNFSFLYHLIYLKNKNFFPQEFYDVSALKYGVSPRDSTSTVYNDYLRNGLLPPTGVTYPGVTFPGTTTNFSTTTYQSQDQDVAQFLRMITLQNDAFVNNIINNTNAVKVKQKYQMLIQFFTGLGIDIRSLNGYNTSILGPLNIY
jgi:hypothetical protein